LTKLQSADWQRIGILRIHRQGTWSEIATDCVDEVATRETSKRSGMGKRS